VQLAAPLSAVTVVVGITLLLAPAMAPGSLFQLLLTPVLVAALGLGASTALLAVAIGAIVATLSLPPFGVPVVDDPRHLPALGLFLAEGAMIAFIGAVVRAAIQMALRHPPDPTEGEAAPARHSARPSVGPLLAERLTPRETEVLQLAAAGRSVDELADELYVSTNTVKTHLAHVYDKLGAHSRAEAIALAVHWGTLKPADLDAALEAGTAPAASGS
jgi:DNA-binding CsgD family transcriptional regulator